MANAHFIPFNQKPSGYDYGSASRSYTCPAGKYARVTAAIRAQVWGGYYFNAGNQGSSINQTESSNAYIWIFAGQQITATSTVNGNTGTDTVVGAYRHQVDANVQVKADTQVWAEATAIATVDYYLASGQAAYALYGATDTLFYVEEYDIPT